MSAPTGTYRVAAAAWWRSELSPTGKLVLIALAEFCNADYLARPSVETLARMTGLSNRAVQKELKKAVTLGEIEIAANKNGGRGQSRTYRLRIADKYGDAVETRKAWFNRDRETDQKGEPYSSFTESQSAERVNITTQKGEPCSPFIPERVNITTQKGEPRSPEPLWNHKKRDPQEEPREESGTNAPPLAPNSPFAFFARGVLNPEDNAEPQHEAETVLEPDIAPEDEAQHDAEAEPIPKSKEPIRVVSIESAKPKRKTKRRSIRHLSGEELNALMPELTTIAIGTAQYLGINPDTVDVEAEIEAFFSHYRDPDVKDPPSELAILHRFKRWCLSWPNRKPRLKPEYRQGQKKNLAERRAETYAGLRPSQSRVEPELQPEPSVETTATVVNDEPTWRRDHGR
jgi:hypothetical protein